MPRSKKLILLAASLCLAAAGVRAATLKAVQSGTAVSTANGILTVPITSVDPTKAFLIFQTRHDSFRPVGSMLRGRRERRWLSAGDRACV